MLGVLKHESMGSATVDNRIEMRFAARRTRPTHMLLKRVTTFSHIYNIVLHELRPRIMHIL